MPRTYVNYIVIIKCIYKVCYNEMKQYEVIAKMPIIRVEIMEIMDEKETQKNKTE